MDSTLTREYKEEVYKLPGSLEAWRKRAGKTQGELAAPLGVTQQTISGWESGASTPSVRHLAEIGRILDVPPSELGAALLAVEGEGIPADPLEDLERRLRRLEEAGLTEPPPH